MNYKAVPSGLDISRRVVDSAAVGGPGREAGGRMNRAEPVRPKDWVCFSCRRCANCCRNLEDQLMLEPLDAYNLARLLRSRGEAASIDDVYARYAHADLLEDCLPIYLMNTAGPEHTCVFLKAGRCSVYEARPYVCRIYPFSVRPRQRGKPSEFYRCVDQHAAHFSGRRMLVKDWLYENFSRESREFWAAEDVPSEAAGGGVSNVRAGTAGAAGDRALSAALLDTVRCLRKPLFAGTGAGRAEQARGLANRVCFVQETRFAEKLRTNRLIKSHDLHIL